MRYVKPHFYDEFSCIADKCPDTCCAGWQIMIDEDTLEKYEAEAFACDRHFREQKLWKDSIDWQEGCFRQINGRCAMLNEHNLCKLVMEKGEDWLCTTCDRYPRHIEEFDGLRELSLSLSCPVAAELILREEPLQFLLEEDAEADPLEEEFADFDFLLFTQLEDARGILFDVIQNRDISIQRRMAIILEMARQLQICVDEERLFDMEEVIREYSDLSGKLHERTESVPWSMEEFCEEAENLTEITDMHAVRRNRYQSIRDGFKTLQGLERLREAWNDVLEETERNLYDVGFEKYQVIHNQFLEEFPPLQKQDNRQTDVDTEWSWEIFQEQLLMFFIYTYFCGAVYDDCIYSKVALAVFSVCYIQEFVMCKWFLADKYIDKQECVQLAYRYAREVEHSDNNLIALEEWFLQRM